MVQKSPIETSQVAPNEHKVNASSPSVTRAEQLMEQWGHRTGLFVAMARQRIQDATSSIQEATPESCHVLTNRVGFDWVSRRSCCHHGSHPQVLVAH